MIKKRRALVSGATGYIGSKLCQRLLSEHWDVGILVRESRFPLAENITGMITAYRYDGSTEGMLSSVAEFNPDVVFHLASLFSAEHRSEQITDLVTSNILFGTQLVEACVRAGVGVFINTGTSWQHYRSSAYDPVCLYAATKQAFENILDFYTDAYPIRAITLKLSDTYGPDDLRPKLINQLLISLKAGLPLGISPGEQLLDLVYIDDVTEAFLCCADRLLRLGKSNCHERYDVSSGTSISVRRLVALMEEVSSRDFCVTFGARPYRSREVMSINRDLRCPPCWKPKIDIETGIRTIVLGS